MTKTNTKTNTCIEKTRAMVFMCNTGSSMIHFMVDLDDLSNELKMNPNFREDDISIRCLEYPALFSLDYLVSYVKDPGILPDGSFDDTESWLHELRIKEYFHKKDIPMTDEQWRQLCKAIQKANLLDQVK